MLLIAVQVRHVDGACNGQLIITAGILGVVSCWRLENTAQVCVVFTVLVVCCHDDMHPPRPVCELHW